MPPPEDPLPEETPSEAPVPEKPSKEEPAAEAPSSEEPSSEGSTPGKVGAEERASKRSSSEGEQGDRPKAPRQRTSIIPRRLRGEARRKALAEPGAAWRDWAFATGFKPWIGLGMLILDAMLLASLVETTVPWTALVALPFVLYSNFLLYQYLWARPPKDLRHRSRFHRNWRHPFLVGRWEVDREKWVSGHALEDATAVPPEEFI